MSSRARVVRRRRRRALLLPVVLAVLIAAAALAWYVFPQAETQSDTPLESWIGDPAAIRAEVVHFGGRPFDPAVGAAVEQARKLAGRRDYRAAIDVLAPVAAKIPVPAIYTDLGLLFAAVNDYQNARASFEAALRVDSGYRAARESLARLKVEGLADDVPVTSEVEPNNTLQHSNAIPLNTAVRASIASGDRDCFRFQTPGRPRDILEISILNRSATLVPTLRLYDSDQRHLFWSHDPVKPGEGLKRRFSPQPSAAYHLEVWGQNGTAGDFGIEVRALRAYDMYEPDDDIAYAARIEPGARVEAGIMDAQDNDYYVLDCPRDGDLVITIENRSDTLLPALAFYGHDKRLTGFGQDAAGAGASLSHTLQVTAGETRYIHVRGRGESSGGYVLTVK